MKTMKIEIQLKKKMKRTIKKENRNPHEKMRKQMGKNNVYK